MDYLLQVKVGALFGLLFLTMFFGFIPARMKWFKVSSGTGKWSFSFFMVVIDFTVTYYNVTWYFLLSVAFSQPKHVYLLLCIHYFVVHINLLDMYVCLRMYVMYVSITHKEFAQSCFIQVQTQSQLTRTAGGFLCKTCILLTDWNPSGSETGVWTSLLNQKPLLNMNYDQCWGKLLLKVMHYNNGLLPKK